MRVLALALLALALGPLAGCVKRDIERLENQVQMLDKRVELMQQDQERANAQLLEGWRRLRSAFESELTTMQRSSADSTTRIDDLLQQMRALSDRIERTGRQYQRLSEQLAALQDRLTRPPDYGLGADPFASDAGAGTAGSMPPTGASPYGSAAAAQPAAEATDGTPAAGVPRSTPAFEGGVDPELTYRAAYSDYAQGNFKLAIVNFETYVRQFPSSAKAVLAQYFIGESHYALGQYRDAVDAFNRVIGNWPGDEKVPVAHLKKGYALLAMGQRGLGMDVLQELISRYPNTHEALLAKERLASL
jgi:tol-pal system protein YbgF